MHQEFTNGARQRRALGMSSATERKILIGLQVELHRLISKNTQKL